MYACILEVDADFSRGCALSGIRAAFLLTHPHYLPFVDRFMALLSAAKQVSASHRSGCLFAAPNLVIGIKLRGCEIGYPPLP
jgi:hypothetical protein